MKTVPTAGEMDRERVEGSLRAWWNKKPGCSDEWLKGELRSSELENVDAVIREREDEFTKSNQWRFLKLRTLVNKVRFDAD